MFHVLEEPQLPVGPLGEELRLEGSVQLLDGHFGPGPAVQGGANGGVESECEWKAPRTGDTHSQYLSRLTEQVHHRIMFLVQQK